MSRRKNRAPARPTVVFDFGGVLSAGHDPVSDLHELLGGDREAVEAALWEHRADYDRGAISPAEYWGRVAQAAGMENLSETEVEDLQDTDNRYFLRLDPASRELIHDLARAEVPLVLLSNASASFGEAVRRADWFEAFSFAVISGEEHVLKPDREIFEILLDALAHEMGGVRQPGAIIFFDDRPDNVEAARALGIDAYLWPRNGETPAAATSESSDSAEHGAISARRVLAARGIALD